MTENPRPTPALKAADPWLFVLAAAMTVVGLFFIYNAGYPRAMARSGSLIPPEFRQQLLYLVPAVLAYFAARRIPHDFWLKGGWLIGLGSFLSLVAVKLFGAEQNGAQRWIDIGPVHIQPAEFAKLACVIYLAGVFATRKPWVGPSKKPRDWAEWLDRVGMPKAARALPAVLVLVAAVMIEKEPDLGTAAVVLATAYALFIAGGVSVKSLAALIAFGLVGVFFLVHQEPYRLERIDHHAHRWEATNVDDTTYQTVQSEYAMASGGVLGVGPGFGRAKHVMPATTTDFIFATIGEEFGLVGALVVLGLLGALVVRLLTQASRAHSPFAKLVLCGVAAWLGVQGGVNLMMANGALPAIGIPFPFISSGGSSLVALWLAIGVCQAVLTPSKAPEEVPVATRAHRWGNGRSRLSRA